MFSPCCQSVAYDDYITEDGWGRCLECMEPVEYPIEQTHQEYWDCECEQNYIHSKYHKTSCDVCDTNMEDQPDSMRSEVAKC
mgnify:CR=1 FL=1|jgi:hypothetical protein|tara:strand:- start:250 stop:495 length:246 start_codon:yes stop_codon:yes gene_type:complete